MYKLSNLAARDFETIYQYTLHTFGILQADAYSENLEQIFHLLSDSPMIGYHCPEIAAGIRRHDHQRHAIFYRVRAQDIFIIRILHQQMEPLRHFPAPEVPPAL